jgi:hypothetical protein
MSPTNRTIPVIDFSQEKNIVADQVLEACRTIGFFYMVNHGLPQDQIDRAFALVRKQSLYSMHIWLLIFDVMIVNTEKPPYFILFYYRARNTSICLRKKNGNT